MAILIPEIPKDCNSSERLVYERLGRELPEVVQESLDATALLLGLGVSPAALWRRHSCDRYRQAACLSPTTASRGGRCGGRRGS